MTEWMEKIALARSFHAAAGTALAPAIAAIYEGIIPDMPAFVEEEEDPFEELFDNGRTWISTGRLAGTWSCPGGPHCKMCTHNTRTHPHHHGDKGRR